MDTYAQAQATTQAGTVRQALAVEGPMIAVGKAPDPRPWHFLSHAPAASRKCSAFRCAARFGELAHVAALYHAAGAEVLNVPGVPGPGAGAAP